MVLAATVFVFLNLSHAKQMSAVIVPGMETV